METISFLIPTTFYLIMGVAGLFIVLTMLFHSKICMIITATLVTFAGAVLMVMCIFRLYPISVIFKTFMNVLMLYSVPIMAIALLKRMSR